jgi:acyl-CoA reductase-like NAD-dependent aldehyde dehydrogenase
MTNPDKQKLIFAEILTRASDAIRNNDLEAFDAAMTEYGEKLSEEILAKVDKTTDLIDSTILAARNVRQLTAGERK